MLRNILGPVFNFNLDQFLTLEFCFFFVFCCFFWGWNPYFYSVFSKKCKIARTQKTKKDTICEQNCANCSCQNVRFFLHFWFLLFLEFPCFSEMFFDWFPKIKKYQKTKQAKQKTTTTRKQDAKQKEMKCYDSKQQKTTSRKNKNKRTSWNKKSKHNKKKKQEPERENEKQEGRKKRTRERQRKRKGRKGGSTKKAKEKQRETLKNKQRMPFFRGKTGILVCSKKPRKESKEKKKQKPKKTKTKRK